MRAEHASPGIWLRAVPYAGGPALVGAVAVWADITARPLTVKTRPGAVMCRVRLYARCVVRLAIVTARGHAIPTLAR
jgi:hypothetical protein